MRYQILIRHQNGTRSYMTYKNRTSWGLRCAQGHLDDFITKLAAGYFPHIANAELEAI